MSLIACGGEFAGAGLQPAPPRSGGNVFEPPQMLAFSIAISPPTKAKVFPA
jgi:hypothetical protein